MYSQTSMLNVRCEEERDEEYVFVLNCSPFETEFEGKCGATNFVIVDPS